MALEHITAEIVDRLAVGDAEPAVDLEEFFAPAFMREHTRFDHFDEFREASPWPVEDRSDLADVPTEELDAFVAETTGFDSWLAMRNAAAERAVVERLMV